ncbi:MAG: nicotinate (nicotinamide) nucleotide adenylyltransferase [Candidatus Levybacteria bacterium]|nr:nicotinate (nicotinamide) nucleotide adenylyltransferase [Candidatus Levybacteria bacterium]
MRIAILGGSFDPPHIGHLLVAGQVKKHLNVDQIWLMPVFDHPFHKVMASPKDRLAMTKFLEGPGILVSDFEINQAKTSFTIDTLDELKKQYPDNSFFWIIGSDQVKDFRKWKEWKRIITDFKLIIYARGDDVFTLEEKAKKYLRLQMLPKTIFLLNTKDLLISDVSSTEIRERIKNGHPIHNMVSRRINEYILQKKLYTK